MSKSHLRATGMADALEEIPKGQLSERQLRIAAGLALIRDEGATPYRAAIDCDVPMATMYRAAKRMTSAEHESGMELNERALVAASFDVAQIAADRITERLVNPDHDWKDGDLVKAYGIATDKIAMRRGWNKGQSAHGSDEGVSALAAILTGKRITIEDHDPAEEALDVTPEPSE